MCYCEIARRNNRWKTVVHLRLHWPKAGEHIGVTKQGNTANFDTNDCIPRLPRVGKNGKTHQVMIQHGIRTIADLIAIRKDELLPIRAILSLQKIATDHALQGNSPSTLVDHQLSDNPYQSK